MKKRIILFIILIFVVLTGALVLRYVFKPEAASVKKQNAEFELSSSELIKAFENDEQAANGLYLGKVILVTGRIDQINNDSEVVTIILKNEDDIAGIICSFDKSVIDPEMVSPGSTVSIKGLCSGYLLDVVLNKCFIVEP